jgi:hypothetical protein
VAAIWQWLIQQGLIKTVADNVIRQGFSILLLIAAIWILSQQYISERDARVRAIEQLRVEIQECQNQILQYYREDRQKSDEIIMQATRVMERLEQRLK